VVEVADRRVNAMTYVGHCIRTGVAPLARPWTEPSRRAVYSEARTLAQRLRAPRAEEH
jgi:hypothetical protein